MNEYTTTDNNGKYYFKDKWKTILHREDGPAIEYADGEKSWYFNDKLHRMDGPAIIHTNGDKLWYINGKLHRMDGPAIEYITGYEMWYVNGVPVFAIDKNGNLINRMK